MKSALRKFFNTAKADNKEEATNMATKDGQAEMTADNKTAELQALLESATTTLAATQGKLAEMTALHEAAQVALKDAEDVKANMAKEAAQAKFDTRKAVVVASVGTARADALMKATESLDDVSFKAVVDAMAGSFEAEAQTAAFKEVGKSTPEDAAQVAAKQDDSEEAKALRAKYQSK